MGRTPKSLLIRLQRKPRPLLKLKCNPMTRCVVRAGSFSLRTDHAATPALSLSLRSRIFNPLTNPAPSGREPQSLCRSSFPLPLIPCPSKEGDQRLPPGGSWQRACSLTEGERGTAAPIRQTYHRTIKPGTADTSTSAAPGHFHMYNYSWYPAPGSTSSAPSA